MKQTSQNHRVYLWVLAAVGILFGLATLSEGGAVLFGDDSARTAAGDYVVFVVWFNFLAGFAYVASGVGLALQQPWATRLAWVIALATLAVFALFAAHIIAGGAFELRTVAAMTLRSAIWLLIATFSWRILRWSQHDHDLIDG